MGVNVNHFRLLLWKNYLLCLRRPYTMIVILIVPMVLIGLFGAVIKTHSDPVHQDEIVFPPFCTMNLKVKKCREGLDAEEAKYLKDFDDFRFLSRGIAYSPMGPAINRVMTYFTAVFSEILPMKTSKQLEEFLYARENSSVIMAAITFDDGVEGKQILPDQIHVAIRMLPMLKRPKDTTWHTHRVFPLVSEVGPREPNATTGARPYYFAESFLGIQHALGVFLALEKTGHIPPALPVLIETWDATIKKIAELKLPYIQMRRYPHASFEEDRTYHFLKMTMAFLVVFSFMGPFVVFVRLVAIEKEKQLKESMKIMGVPNWIHWLAWFSAFLIILVFLVAIIVIITKVPLNHGFAIFTFSDFYMVFIFLLIYSCALITSAFALSVCCSKANTATILAVVLFITSLVPFIVTRDSLMEPGYQYLGLLIPNAALAFGIDLIVVAERMGTGTRVFNLFQYIMPDHTFPLGVILFFLILDAFIFLLLALYIEAVFPGKLGTPKPWNFLCSPGYWFRKRHNAVEDSPYDFPNINPSGEFFEKEPPNLQPGVKMHSLRKEYDDSVPVRDLTLTLYEGQTTVLLGTSGVGKTTACLLLTGVVHPTTGTATVNGYDIKEDLLSVRYSVGMCFQDNVLYDELTVKEFLYLTVRLKGVDARPALDEVDKYLAMLDLRARRHTKIQFLSYGIQRKLSVGTALCADSRVVIMDEPTFGMDSPSRRALWDLLSAQRPERTIFITTCSMMEADAVGDRIAIMRNGELKCCGSSTFLRKKFSTGYYLVINKGDNCDVPRITGLIRKYIPNARLMSNRESQVTYNLLEHNTPIFERLLKDLENQSLELGILDFVVRLYTLEDVFKMIGSLTRREYIKPPQISSIVGFTERTPSVSHMYNTGKYYASGCSLIFNQYEATFMKRVAYIKYDWPVIVAQLILPLLLILMGVLIHRADKDGKDLPAMPLTLQKFPGAQPLVELHQAKSPVAKRYKKIYNAKEVDSIHDYAMKMSAQNPADLKTKYVVGIAAEDGKMTIASDPIVIKVRKNITAEDGNDDEDFVPVEISPSVELEFNGVITIWFQNDPYHTPAIGLGMLLNAFYKEAADCSSCSITFYNWPLPLSAAERMKRLSYEDNPDRVYALNKYITAAVLISVSFFVLFAVREHIPHSKHLQFVSGCKVFVFWSTTFIWDMLVWFLLMSGIVFLLLCSRENHYNTGGEIGRLFVLGLLLGWCMVPVCYLFSYLFNDRLVAFFWLVGINSLLGCLAVFLVRTMTAWTQEVEMENGNTMWPRVVHIALMAVPHYCFYSALTDMFIMEVNQQLCQTTREICSKSDYFEDCMEERSPYVKEFCKVNEYPNFIQLRRYGIGLNVVWLFSLGVLLFILILLIDLRVFSQLYSYVLVRCCGRKPRVAPYEDDDIVRERHIIKTTPRRQLITENIVVLEGVTKYYGRSLVVNNVSLTVGPNDCFGLIGGHGAGKTAMLRLLTGDSCITSGEAWVAGHRVKTSMKTLQRNVGYCPQCDTLLESLTIRETLMLFGLIRGVRYTECRKLVMVLAEDFNFKESLDIKVVYVSRILKRKVCNAIALMGNPRVIFLDEPTAGLDTVQRKYVIEALTRIRAAGKCIVLTSCNLDEVESICTKIAVMVNGRLRCLGSTAHLQNRFAKGYCVWIKVRREAADRPRTGTENLEKFMREVFPKAVLVQKHMEMLAYKQMDESIPWSTMFGILETMKKRKLLNMDDYTLTQNSLEQVYLTFTKYQR